jgi:hypothetical protein
MLAAHLLILLLYAGEGNIYAAEQGLIALQSSLKSMAANEGA